MKITPSLFLFFAAALIARGQGTFVYDQQSVSSDGVGSGPPINIQSQQPIGQSFTPKLSSVGFVRLWLRDSNPGNSLGATVHLNLLADSITGPILGASSSVSMLDGFGNTRKGYIDFLFSMGITVTPGVTYYFQPVVELGGDAWAISAYHFGYSGGSAFFNGTAYPNSDMWFREGIVVPEPSGLLLLGLGFGVLFYARRVKNKRSPLL